MTCPKSACFNLNSLIILRKRNGSSPLSISSTKRIELLAEDMDRFMDVKIREGVYEEFKKIGFEYTALDLKGYRTGSLNENLFNR